MWLLLLSLCSCVIRPRTEPSDLSSLFQSLFYILWSCPCYSFLQKIDCNMKRQQENKIIHLLPCKSHFCPNFKAAFGECVWEPQSVGGCGGKISDSLCVNRFGDSSAAGSAASLLPNLSSSHIAGRRRTFWSGLWLCNQLMWKSQTYTVIVAKATLVFQG